MEKTSKILLGILGAVATVTGIVLATKKSAGASGDATVRFESVPSGAQILINDVPVGVTPYVFNVDTHGGYIMFEWDFIKSGYSKHSGVTGVHAGDYEMVKIDLASGEFID